CIRGRHEVGSRLALLNQLGTTPDESVRVDVPVTDGDRVAIARRLTEAWPRRIGSARRAEVYAHARRRGRSADSRQPRPLPPPLDAVADEADWLHADRFSPLPPLLAVHLGAAPSAKPWPPQSWKGLVERCLQRSWRAVGV